MLEIRMLGKFDVQFDGEPIDIPSRAAQSLLAYLVLNAGTSYRREKLAGQFWPDSSEQNTRNYLRQALWQLRKTIGQDFVQADNLNIEFDADSDYWLDVSVLISSATQEPSPEDLLAKVSVYSGELLPGFYDDWVVLERDRLQSVFDQKMQRMLDRLAKEQRWTDILEWGERWVSLGQVPEPAYRALMRAHHGLGDAASLAAVYQRCIRTLQEEFDVEPSAETRSLYERLAREEAPRGSTSEEAVQGPTEVASGPTQETTRLNLLDRIVRGRMVGRRRELAEAHSYWQQVLSGEGQMLLISGEPGIGKTRLVQEIARQVEKSGGIVLTGECFAEGSAPYTPVAQMIREGLSHDLQLNLPEMVLADLITIAPDLRAQFPDTPPNPPLDPVAEQQRLFESIALFCIALSAHAPLLLFIDDMHWADSGTVYLLRYLARRLQKSSALLVATYREAELYGTRPFEDVLQYLSRARLAHRIKLSRLEPEETEAMLKVLFAQAIPSEFLGEIYRETEGNPFFVEEVCKSLVESEKLYLEDGAWQLQSIDELEIPQSIRSAVQSRVARLPSNAQQVLQWAAVIGREFDFETLRAVSEMEEDALIDALEAAHTAQLVAEVQSRAGERFAFVHALISAALRENLSGLRRGRLHRKVAAAIEKLRPHDYESLAYHSGEAGDEAQALTYLTQAADKARQVYANEDAVRYYGEVLAVKEGQEMDAESASLLFGLGKAQAALLQMPDARASLTGAFDYYVEVEDISKAVEIAEYPVEYGNVGFSELVIRALELVPPDSHEAGRLLSQHGLNLGIRQADYEAAQEALDQALAIAQREGDIALEMWTHARAGRVGFFHLRNQECIVKDEQAMELNREVGDPNIAPFSGLCVVAAQMCIGDLEGALSNLETMLNMAEKARFSSGLVTAYASKAQFSLATGDWESVREITDRGLSLSPNDSALLDARLFLEYTLGHFDQGEVYLKRVQELNQRSPPGSIYSHVALTLVGIISNGPTSLEMAKEAARTLLSAHSIAPIFTTEANIGLGLIAVQENDREDAKEHYRALEPLRATANDHMMLSMDRILGLLAQAMGNLDDAQAHFADALTFCREAGYHPESARSLCDYADMLLERNGQGDHEKAMALLDESLAISTELGMRPLMERVQSRREILKA